jgi:hypothetical protein
VLATSFLVAIVAVLVGFLASTMMLGMTTLGGEAERNTKLRPAPPRSEAAVPVAKPAQASASVADVVAAPAVPANAEPLGIAAAAKAKAQAELEAMADDPPAPEPVRRRARVPRVELHKVY